ncbi:hypothetical protein NL676_008828 [Syzygium grande]|nr:hypothetical protein NL676_008828 [Syzygium grande]
MDGLARRIPAGGSIQVDSRKYDLNERNPGSQIYILFRVGNSNNVEEFLESLKKESLEGVKVKHGEQLFLHFHLLSNPRLYFNCDEAGQAIRDVNDVGQGVAAETQNESELGNLIEEVPSNQQELTVEVKALRTDIATLKNMLKRCDPLQANPNSSSSTNTFSPSK